MEDLGSLNFQRELSKRMTATRSLRLVSRVSGIVLRIDRMFEIGLSTSRKLDRCRVVALLMLLLLVNSVRLLGVVLPLSLSLGMSLTVLSMSSSLFVQVLVGSRVEHLVLSGRDGTVPEVVVVGLSGIAEVVQVGRHCLLLVVVGGCICGVSDEGERKRVK